MPVVKFISNDGSEKDVQVASGTSVMQAALDNEIEGILAECHGALSCATCHVYIDEKWQSKVGEADDVEKEMLDFVMDPQPNSRLSCQVVVRDDLDGLVVRVPKN